MRVLLKTEFTGAKEAPEQQHCRGCDNEQRRHLLPIHTGNIVSKISRATNDFSFEEDFAQPVGLRGENREN